MDYPSTEEKAYVWSKNKSRENWLDKWKKEKEKLKEFNEKMKKINYTQQVKLLELEISRNENLYIENMKGFLDFSLAKL